MIYSKIDDFTNSLFHDINGNFNWNILMALGIGILIGMFFAATIYGILLLLSLNKSERKLETPKEIDEELLETIKLIKKDYIRLTSGFSPSEKLKVLGNTILNTMKVVAQKYYPNSKYPLYELNINELVILTHYIANRIDQLFDKNILKYCKNISISQILNIIDVKRKVTENKAVKAAKKANPVLKVVTGIINYANPVYWIKKVLFGGTLNVALNKMSLIVIDIVGAETIRVYSKRLFSEETLLLDDVIKEEIKEMEELE